MEVTPIGSAVPLRCQVCFFNRGFDLLLTNRIGDGQRASKALVGQARKKDIRPERRLAVVKERRKRVIEPSESRHARRWFIFVERAKGGMKRTEAKTPIVCRRNERSRECQSSMHRESCINWHLLAARISESSSI